MTFVSVFCFIDEITEVKKNESLTAAFTLKGSEEFLLDHFEGFPVMPGVLMLESLKQAAQSLLVLSGDYEKHFFRLISVEVAKFGQFVRPKDRLRISVRLVRKEGMTSHFEGSLERVDSASGQVQARVLSARLAMGPVSWTIKEKKEYLGKFARLGFKGV